MALHDPLLPLAPVLDPIFDPLTIRATRAIQKVLKGPPLRAEHARSRERALIDVVAKYAPQIAAVTDAVLARDEAAIATFDATIARAAEELRGEAEERAAQSRFERFAHAVDRVVHKNSAEWLDDPAFDETLRVRTLERLDRMNEAIGAYDAFFAAIEPSIDRARSAGVDRPIIVDLASGHAMFAVALALRFGAREAKVRVIATDLAPEYLEIGRARAKKLAMNDDMISFMQQDALDLRDLPARVGASIDVVTCTQTIHHFAPGMVSRLFAEASAAARHGAILVDGERNPFALAMITGVSVALGRGSVPFLHDAFVSMRRMYTEQELALFAMLAPGSRCGMPRGPIERGWVSPGHVYVRSV
jgi:SAM-dependent methyltransferase